MVPTVFNGIEGVNLVLLEKRVRELENARAPEQTVETQGGGKKID